MIVTEIEIKIAEVMLLFDQIIRPRTTIHWIVQAVAGHFSIAVALAITTTASTASPSLGLRDHPFSLQITIIHLNITIIHYPIFI